MMVTLFADVTCPSCGNVDDGAAVQVSVMRVNKTSLKSIGSGPDFALGPPRCPACKGDYTALAISRWRLAPDDQARVDAYRAKHFKASS